MEAVAMVWDSGECGFDCGGGDAEHNLPHRGVDEYVDSVASSE